MSYKITQSIIISHILHLLVTFPLLLHLALFVSLLVTLLLMFSLSDLLDHVNTLCIRNIITTLLIY